MSSTCVQKEFVAIDKYLRVSTTVHQYQEELATIEKCPPVSTRWLSASIKLPTMGWITADRPASPTNGQNSEEDKERTCKPGEMIV